MQIFLFLYISFLFTLVRHIGDCCKKGLMASSQDLSSFFAATPQSHFSLEINIIVQI